MEIIYYLIVFMKNIILKLNLKQLYFIEVQNQKNIIFFMYVTTKIFIIKINYDKYILINNDIYLLVFTFDFSFFISFIPK